MKTENQTVENKKPRKKTVILVLAVLFLVLGIASLGYGAYIAIENQKTDSEGYALSNVYEVNSSVYVFALWMNEYDLSPIWRALGADNFAQLKYIVTSTDPNKELFVGYATASDAGPYLGQGITYETAYPEWNWIARPYYAAIEIPSTQVVNEEFPMAPPRLPQEETFWRISTHTNTTTKMYYLPLNNMYTLFIMNQDGSQGVQATLQIGFKVPIFSWLPYLLITVGLVLVLVGVYLLLRRKQK